jgi:hypothetical protein
MHTLNAGTKYDDDTSNKHAPFAASEISSGPSNKSPSKITNGVNCVDDAGRRRSLVDTETEIAAVLRVAVDGAHQTSIVTIDAGIQGRNQQNEIELDNGKPRIVKDVLGH